MCYDISLHSNIELTKQAFPQLRDRRTQFTDTNPGIEHVTSFGFPEYPVLANIDGELVLTEMEWSVNPTFEKDEKQRLIRRRKMANATTEKVLEDKRSFWQRIKNNRCLIPMSGNYEHREIEGWKNKVPYYIWMADRETYHLPGFYHVEDAVDADGQPIKKYSFALLTRPANEVLKLIHNSGEFRHRMPLYLTPEIEEFWLSNQFTNDDMKAVFDYMMPGENFNFQTVYSVRGRTPRPDGKHKYDLWTYDNLPPLGQDKPLEPQASLF